MEALDKGCFVIVGIDTRAFCSALTSPSPSSVTASRIPVPDCMDKNVSSKVVRIIQNYVWCYRQDGLEEVLAPFVMPGQTGHLSILFLLQVEYQRVRSTSH